MYTHLQTEEPMEIDVVQEGNEAENLTQIHDNIQKLTKQLDSIGRQMRPTPNPSQSHPSHHPQSRHQAPPPPLPANPSGRYHTAPPPPAPAKPLTLSPQHTQPGVKTWHRANTGSGSAPAQSSINSHTRRRAPQLDS